MVAFPGNPFQPFRHGSEELAGAACARPVGRGDVGEFGIVSPNIRVSHLTSQRKISTLLNLHLRGCVQSVEMLQTGVLFQLYQLLIEAFLDDNTSAQLRNDEFRAVFVKRLKNLRFVQYISYISCPHRISLNRLSVQQADAPANRFSFTSAAAHPWGRSTIWQATVDAICAKMGWSAREVLAWLQRFLFFWLYNCKHVAS